MIEKLKQRFDSLLKVFEILYVIDGVKPVSRIMVNEEDYKTTKNFLEKSNLYVDKAGFKVLRLDKGHFSNKGEKVSLNDQRKGYYFVYVSKNKNLVRKARAYEEKNDHLNLGLILGYPECCCEFFQKNHKTQEKKFNDYILPSLNASEGFVFPFYNNFAARYFDLALLSHFPCNFNCKESLSIAKKHLSVIEKHSNEYATVLRGMLKGAVVYTENYGVFLLRESKIKGSEITYNTIMGNEKNKLSDILRKNNKLELIDKHSIKIMNQDIKTENLGAMFFI